MDEQEDPRRALALARFQVISAYLAFDPPRGQRGPLRAQLAEKRWLGPDGEPMRVSAETIRAWVRRYRNHGLRGLYDKPRAGHRHALSQEQVELACRLKQEVPERSLERIITIMEELDMVERGVVRRSTLHRALQRRGLSARAARVPDAQDLDRFEALAPNDLWQSDMLTGPWLEDPEQPGKMRRAYLYAFLDDHSRALLAGRFSFKGDLPALELVFRRALQKHGVPRRVYYDNGQTYRSQHMRQIVAELGIHGIVHTQPYRPMGHGKIEAFNRLVRSAFLAELKASSITTLDGLNEAFVAWVELSYNRRPHSETNERPRDRWRAGAERVRYADDEALRQAFLWREQRTPDKTGVLSLFGVRYQVSAGLARKRVEVRYDPERRDEVEIWQGDALVERVRPFEVEPHRRPRAADEEAAPATAEPVADWLGHLVDKRRAGFIEVEPKDAALEARRRRREEDDAVVELLRGRLLPAVFDEPALRAHLERFGPYDPCRARAAIEHLLAGGVRDHHIDVYLGAIRRAHRGDVP